MTIIRSDTHGERSNLIRGRNSNEGLSCSKTSRKRGKQIRLGVMDIKEKITGTVNAVSWIRIIIR